MKTPGVFTSGLSASGGTAANFFSDSDAYAVRLDDNGEAKLASLHTVTLSAVEHGTLSAALGDTPLASGDKAAGRYRHPHSHPERGLHAGKPAHGHSGRD